MTRPTVDSPAEDCLVKRINVALQHLDGETVILSRTASENGRYGRARRVSWRGEVLATHVCLTTLAIELGVVR